MTIHSGKEKTIDTRKRLSIELCDNFTRRLNPSQKKEIKIGALIAIRNFIDGSRMDDPILFSFLVDTITDPDKEIRDWVSKIIKELANKEITELLEIKLQEATGNIKNEIKTLVKSIN